MQPRGIDTAVSRTVGDHEPANLLKEGLFPYVGFGLSRSEIQCEAGIERPTVAWQKGGLVGTSLVNNQGG